MLEILISCIAIVDMSWLSVQRNHHQIQDGIGCFAVGVSASEQIIKVYILTKTEN